MAEDHAEMGVLTICCGDVLQENIAEASLPRKNLSTTSLP